MHYLHKNVNLNSYKIVSVPNHLIACSTYIKKFRVIRILSADNDLNENHCASVIKDPVSPQPAPLRLLLFVSLVGVVRSSGPSRVEGEEGPAGVRNRLSSPND